jgi:calcineurin-like phosphoesterase family protein
MIWFTADWHLLHKNIIHLEDRPFDSLNEMHETIVNNWNEVVDEKDTIYNLGDITFGSKEKTLEIIYELKGNIYVIRGNHDKGLDKLASRFCGIYDYLELKKEKIILFHYPIISWNGSYKDFIHLHGHCHGNLRPIYDSNGKEYKSKRLDVGIESHDYYPINLDRVYQLVDNIKFNPIDHHEPK